LSLARADAVRNALVERGVDAARITTAGFGADAPVAENDTATGRARNRRVEVIVEGG
jgi:outer membrane protein OmpA-like peptidoglycan-associated protein